MDVIRFAWESGFFTVPFAVWEPALFLAFWGTVLLGGGIQYLILRLAKRRWLYAIFPILLAVGMLTVTIAGQGVTGWDVFAFVILWFGCFSLLCGTGAAFLLRFVVNRRRKNSTQSRKL